VKKRIVADAMVLNRDFEVNGSVVSSDYVELQPEVSGRITFLNVPEGRFVTEGTVIARINDADLTAQLQKSESQLRLAELTEERLKKLINIQGVNQADYDAALNQVNTLRADIEYYKALIDKTIIKAPFGGKVGLRRVSLGAYVTTGTVIATIHQMDNQRVDFTVPEEYSDAVKVGESVDVIIDQNKQEKIKARIIATEPAFSVDTRSLTVRAILSSSKSNPGAFARVFIKQGQNKKQILIPSNSIIPESKTKSVVVIKNGKATFTEIVTGVRDEQLVEVTNGLSIGDTVVVSGMLFTRPGSAVDIRSVVSLADLNVQ
jgi:membrane fusion protein (multidrug efflux system)